MVLVLDYADMISVVSTGFKAPTRAKCEASVREQTVKPKHVYIEASEQSPPRTVTENVWRAVRELPDDEIVTWMDGDDWLANPFALECVLNLYEFGADCTYGSFAFSDGRKPALRAYENHRNCRKEPWLGTHLKTFRAGLLQAVPAAELMHGGEWISMACDMAIMFPVLELARNAVFCPEILAIYNYSSSWEFRFTAEDAARERAMVAELRGRRPLSR